MFARKKIEALEKRVDRLESILTVWEHKSPEVDIRMFFDAMAATELLKLLDHGLGQIATTIKSAKGKKLTTDVINELFAKLGATDFSSRF